jgi:starch synthase
MSRCEGQISVRVGFDERLSHLIEAGSDYFVMPSRYEPCGLNQMYSMISRSFPIVHATGGLIDTVNNHDELTGTGTGFVFYDLTDSALHNAIGWACATHYDRPKDFEKLQQSAMKKDFSWSKSAKEYENIYLAAMGKL